MDANTDAPGLVTREELLWAIEKAMYEASSEPDQPAYWALLKMKQCLTLGQARWEEREREWQG